MLNDKAVDDSGCNSLRGKIRVPRQADLLPNRLEARLVAPRIPALIEDQVNQFIVPLERFFEKRQVLFLPPTIGDLLTKDQLFQTF